MLSIHFSMQHLLPLCQVRQYNLIMTIQPISLPPDDFARRQAKYAPVSRLLSEMYGYPEWRQWLPPLDELIDCILSQSTTDLNRDRAFDALKATFPTWEAVRDAPVETVIETIRPAGL